jgi:hypothetical protein
VTDARGLKELGLLEVTRLYGLDAAPPVDVALRARLAESAPGVSWFFVDCADAAEGPAEPSNRLLEAMLAAIGCRAAGEGPFAEALERSAPRVIVALGEEAARALLGAQASLAGLRGQVHRYRDIPVVVTYHPASLLRTLADKARAWEDLLFARRTVATA